MDDKSGMNGFTTFYGNGRILSSALRPPCARQSPEAFQFIQETLTVWWRVPVRGARIAVGTDPAFFRLFIRPFPFERFS